MLRASTFSRAAPPGAQPKKDREYDRQFLRQIAMASVSPASKPRNASPVVAQ